MHYCYSLPNCIWSVATENMLCVIYPNDYPDTRFMGPTWGPSWGLWSDTPSRPLWRHSYVHEYLLSSTIAVDIGLSYDNKCIFDGFFLIPFPEWNIHNLNWVYLLWGTLHNSFVLRRNQGCSDYVMEGTLITLTKHLLCVLCKYHIGYECYFQ